jgi:hypothetical protein
VEGNGSGCGVGKGEIRQGWVGYSCHGWEAGRVGGIMNKIPL